MSDNIIVIVLGNPAKNDGTHSDIMKSRVNRAIEIFKNGKIEKIIFSGNANLNKYNEAEIMADYAISNRLPENIIIKEKKAKDTIENAIYSSEIIKKLNYRHIIIITSDFHYTRSKLIFSLFFSNFEIQTVSLPPNTGVFVRIKLIIWELFLYLKLLLFRDKRIKGGQR